MCRYSIFRSPYSSHASRSMDVRYHWFFFTNTPRQYYLECDLLTVRRSREAGIVTMEMFTRLTVLLSIFVCSEQLDRFHKISQTTYSRYVSTKFYPYILILFIDTTIKYPYLKPTFITLKFLLKNI